MADNSQRLLDEILIQQQEKRDPEISRQDYFEIFCAEQILKDFNLSDEELLAGIVDGAQDGGIDSVYAFVNGALVCEDFDYKSYQKDISIELHIIQSTTAAKFSEALVNQLKSTAKDLLELDANYQELTDYCPEVRAILDNFRIIYKKLGPTFPALKLSFCYASTRPQVPISTRLLQRAEELKDIVHTLFSEAEFEFRFLGAGDLLELARRHPQNSYELHVSKCLSATDSYLVLCPLREYASFLTDPGGNLRAELFESNVRDFQGATEVNADIAKTLQSEAIVDFWWMNNGVTILVSRAALNGDIVTIQNPQIVNGLQTSTQIAQHLRAREREERAVMIKIVASENEETRDKIIKATNSQTTVQAASLRATDKIQRDIEEILVSEGLYYDRRKNFYKNKGKPIDKIISIPLMAQAVMTLVLQSPNTARARPSTLIKRNDDYGKVFSEDYPIGLYAKAASLIGKTMLFLKHRTQLTARDRNNLRFYVTFWVAALHVKKLNPTPEDIANLNVETVPDKEFEFAVTEVVDLYKQFGESDQAAKGVELRDAMFAAIKQQLGLS